MSKIKQKHKQKHKHKSHTNKSIPSPPLIVKVNTGNSKEDIGVFIKSRGDFDNKIAETTDDYPIYNKKKWSKKNVEDNHNCYAYALNNIKSASNDKAQPGYFSNFSRLKDSDYSCHEFLKRLKKR